VSDQHTLTHNKIDSTRRAMVRDKDTYGPDADEFRPERFLNPNMRDPKSIVFGFGRRYD
jgi:cytochrome P450